MEKEIRRLQKKDYPVFDDLMRELHSYHVSNRPDLFKERAHPIAKTEYYSMIEDGNKILLSCVNEKGDIIGIILATIRNNSIMVRRRNVYIDALYIVREYRRCGAATRLFREVEKISKNKRAHRIELMTWEFNSDASMFYKSLGMKEQRKMLELEV